MHWQGATVMYLLSAPSSNPGASRFAAAAILRRRLSCWADYSLSADANTKLRMLRTQDASRPAAWTGMQQAHLGRWSGPGATVARHGDAAGRSRLLLRAHPPAAARLDGGLHPVIA